MYKKKRNDIDKLKTLFFGKDYEEKRLFSILRAGGLEIFRPMPFGAGIQRI